MDTLLAVLNAIGYHVESKQPMRIRTIYFVDDSGRQHIYGVMAECWSITSHQWVISTPHVMTLERAVANAPMMVVTNFY